MCVSHMCVPYHYMTKLSRYVHHVVIQLHCADNPGDAPNITDLSKLRETINAALTGSVTLPSNCAEAYMFPRQLWTNDHCHMYFNSLEEAIKKDTEWNYVDDVLRNGIAPFMSNRGLRQRFQAQLPCEKRKLFSRFSRVHIDWKWEFLESALGQVEPLLDELFASSLGWLAQLATICFPISLRNTTHSVHTIVIIAYIRPSYAFR